MMSQLKQDGPWLHGNKHNWYLPLTDMDFAGQFWVW
jgi:hypothetical protein